MLKALLFDFDGTIVDSKRATIDLIQDTLNHFNEKIPPEKEMSALFGYKLPEVLRRILPNASSERVHEIFIYSQTIVNKHASKVEFMPNVLDVLESLKEEYRLGLVTSRGKAGLQHLFKLHNLHYYFKLVVDREDVAQHKPHPEGIFKAMKSMEVSPEEVLYIGDTEVDVEAAHNAGISCILIGTENQHFEADYHITYISELPALLKIIETNQNPRKSALNPR